MAILLKSFATFPGYARHAGDAVAASFVVRAAHGFLALAFLTLPFLLIALAVAARRSRSRAGRGLAFAFLGWAAFIAAGALIAAVDARNERGWNPALYGSVFAAAAFPAALAAGLPREDEGRRGAILCAGIAAFPITLLIAAVGPLLIEWGLRNGWPVGW